MPVPVPNVSPSLSEEFKRLSLELLETLRPYTQSASRLKVSILLGEPWM